VALELSAEAVLLKTMALELNAKAEWNAKAA
jgi:hypothetical protein